MQVAPIEAAIVALENAAALVLKLAGEGGLDGLGDEEFLDAARNVDAARCALETFDHSVVAGVETRELATKFQTRTSAGFLAALYRIDITPARQRLREAQAFGPRLTMTGEAMEPLRPAAAAARACGAMNSAQAAVVLDMVKRLPSGLPVDQVDRYEQILVTKVHALPPADLRILAQQVIDGVDPDGPEPNYDEQQRRRDLTFSPQRDGMTKVSGLLDSLTAAKAAAVFGAMAAPRKDDAGGRDERTPGQRRHDAFATLLEHAGSCTHLPTGSPVTVHITMTADQYETRTGHASTGYGQHIHVPEAFRMADQASVAWLIHGSKGDVLYQGRNERCATKKQADALLVRDGGCAFPTCDQPGTWCQRHHIIEWQDGGLTDIDNLVLLCPYHHARHLAQGWVIEMRAGVPWFIPPVFIDPEQKPLRNIRGLGTCLGSG